MCEYTTRLPEIAPRPGLRPPPCPQCRRAVVQRTHRRGLFERVGSLFWLYPFRCQRCGHRFRAKQRGVRYVRTLL